MRRKREAKITGEEAYTLFNTYLLDSNHLAYFISTNSELEKSAIRIMSNHTLKGSDALQLACALDTFKLFGSDLHFVCNDAQLVTAASREGLSILRPGEEEALEYIKYYTENQNQEEMNE